MLPDWQLAPMVTALPTMRGIAPVNAATMVAELGDLSRFANPRQLMAYLGLVPCEHSSSASVERGGLTKAGNQRRPPAVDGGGPVLPLSSPDQSPITAAPRGAVQTDS